MENKIMLYIGAAIIGALTAFMGYPIYDFTEGHFSIKNLIILILLNILWIIMFRVIDNGSN